MPSSLSILIRVSSREVSSCWSDLHPPQCKVRSSSLSTARQEPINTRVLSTVEKLSLDLEGAQLCLEPAAAAAEVHKAVTVSFRALRRHLDIDVWGFDKMLGERKLSPRAGP